MVLLPFPPNPIPCHHLRHHPRFHLHPTSPRPRSRIILFLTLLHLTSSHPHLTLVPYRPVLPPSIPLPVFPHFDRILLRLLLHLSLFSLCRIEGLERRGFSEQKTLVLFRFGRNTSDSEQMALICSENTLADRVFCLGNGVCRDVSGWRKTLRTVLRSSCRGGLMAHGCRGGLMARGCRGGLVVDAGEEKGVAGDGFAGHGAERRAVIRDQTAVLERQAACNLLVSRG